MLATVELGWECIVTVVFLEFTLIDFIAGTLSDCSSSNEFGGADSTVDSFFIWIASSTSIMLTLLPRRSARVFLVRLASSPPFKGSSLGTGLPEIKNKLN